MELFDLTGRVAVVTGGNGGIGFGMAQGLAAAGATVVVAGRNAAKGASAVAALRTAGAGDSAFIAVDVAQQPSCRALVEQTVARFGRLDILVNNAGVNTRKQPQDYAPEEWHEILDANLAGTFFCAQAAYPHMKAAGAGKIVNVGSMTSIFGASFAAPYAASKGGVVQLTRSLAVAWAPDNIQVNAVLPGWIDTELTEGARQQVAGLNERVVARTPAGRWGLPADFAGVAVFLASPASGFVTGTAIPIDGGYSVQLS